MFYALPGILAARTSEAFIDSATADVRTYVCACVHSLRLVKIVSALIVVIQSNEYNVFMSTCVLHIPVCVITLLLSSRSVSWCSSLLYYIIQTTISTVYLFLLPNYLSLLLKSLHPTLSRYQ